MAGIFKLLHNSPSAKSNRQGLGGGGVLRKDTPQTSHEKNNPAAKEAREKAAWLKKTRNSPAAKAFGRGKKEDEARWQAHKASKKPRKKSQRGGMSNQRGSVLARRNRLAIKDKK